MSQDCGRSWLELREDTQKLGSEPPAVAWGERPLGLTILEPFTRFLGAWFQTAVGTCLGPPCSQPYVGACLWSCLRWQDQVPSLGAS